jgi:hypothetical protein
MTPRLKLFVLAKLQEIRSQTRMNVPDTSPGEGVFCALETNDSRRR